MIWTTIFDVRDKPWREFTMLLFGLIFLIAAAKDAREVFARHEDDFDGETMNATEHRFLGVFATVFGLLFVGLTSYSAWNYLGLIRTLNTGAYQHVEGPVTRFYQTAWKGNATEIFSVGTMRVNFTDFDALSKDANTITYPGCLREGVPVRISYDGNVVLKIEIETRSGQAPPTCRQNDAPFLFPPSDSTIQPIGSEPAY